MCTWFQRFTLQRFTLFLGLRFFLIQRFTLPFFLRFALQRFTLLSNPASACQDHTKVEKNSMMVRGLRDWMRMKGVEAKSR